MPAALADDPLWYKDAVVYQVHVRGYSDSNGDGIGDFTGLTSRLDYIQSLGVTCLWILPFYPSPLRDDGYDIARYEGVHASYGSLDDFRRFLDGAHARGLRVITELVINHTSDQHPWFQAARRAPVGSSKRNFYVWSDTDQRYPGVPVIFSDTERSNWTWDPTAGQYYWHRFFHHQPDLNFDHPHVRRAILKVMRFWLDQGVDGLRLDAVPYLIERDGTGCANLPETHDVLRELRREVDRRYRNRMLLAEANLWPTDVTQYFGDGDECHMAFHFPLMPRMFMALRQEDRHPISEILWQTPEIPDSCQWAIFLRNHDELTLEMVTDEERDYMYQTYAADPQMRVNAGIRRRLAPLMENSRRRIELLNGLLLSLPGTPTIYYGDEIGMGDNVFLGDRNGVRTPMQWTADRNAGFSRADPARLYAPVIMDPVYGYPSVNVEAQERLPFSLLNWMRRFIALRQRTAAFGRGAIEILRPENRRIFAFVRRLGTESPILVVANLSRSMQPATLELGRYAGLVPVEMSGGTELPRIGEQPYFLTLGGYAFYWLSLERQPAEPVTVKPHALPAERDPEQLPLLLGPDWPRMLANSSRQLLERTYFAPFLRRQRWFQRRESALTQVRVIDWGVLEGGETPTLLTVMLAAFQDGQQDRYLVPLATAAGPRADQILRERPDAIVARIAGAKKGVLHAALDPQMAERLFQVIRDGREVPLREGRLRGVATAGLSDVLRVSDPADLVPAPASIERGNSSIRLGERFLLKVIRRVLSGRSPEIELGRVLFEETGYTRVPRPAGWIDYHSSSDEPATVTMVTAFIPHQMDAWRQALGDLERYLEAAIGWDPEDAVVLPRVNPWTVEIPERARATIGAYLESAASIGRRTAELHLALAGPEVARACGTARLDVAALDARVRRLEASAAGMIAGIGGRALDHITASLVRLVAGRRDALLQVVSSLAERVPAGLQLIRIHGSLDLEQVLLSEGDFMFIDLEGDPAQSIEERRRLESPLIDVATMARSFHYAAGAGFIAHQARAPHEHARLRIWAEWWRTWTTASFLQAYRAAADGAAFVPGDLPGLQAWFRLALLERLFVEAQREAAHRPSYLWIPLEGILTEMGQVDGVDA